MCGRGSDGELRVRYAGRNLGAASWDWEKWLLDVPTQRSEGGT